MVPISPKDCKMLQLKAIVNGMHNEMISLQEIKKFEAKNSLKKFDILTKLQDLLPFATSLLSIKQIITVFARKLISLLEDLNVLKSAELSQECLNCIKKFWALCSCQQNAVSSSQLFGRWDAVLLETISPLASILVDLSIVAHQDKEKRSMWSKKLYSWLSFDLPDRAIKVALLEVTCHTQDGADIVIPILNKVLLRPLEEESNPDYLLHFLLLKKWQGVTDVSDIVKKSKSLKAPASFLEWLKTYWKSASDYIPDDKRLKGMLVSQFLLDLDTEEVLEPLTDVLQMAIFPEGVQNDVGVASDTPLFVVDKKGTGKLKKRKHSPQEGSAEPKVTTGRKRSAREIVDSPQKNNLVGEEEGDSVEVAITLSPRKKKAKMGKDEGKDTLGFVLDRGPAARARCETIVEIDNEEGKDDGKDSFSFVLDREPAAVGVDAVVQIDSEEEEVESIDSDSEMSDDDDEEKEQTECKLVASEEKQKTNPELVDDESESENDDSDGSEIIEIQDDNNVVPSPTNLAAAVLKRKQILISDPVASSYFQSGNRQDEENDIHVFEITDEDNVIESSVHEEKDQRSPQKFNATDEDDDVALTKTKAKKSPRTRRIAESPKKTLRADVHVKEIAKSIASHYKKSDSAAIEVNSDSSNSSSIIVGKQIPGNKQVHPVYSVTVDNDDTEFDNLPEITVLDEKQSSGGIGSKFIEEDIATKLSAIRKSTPSAQLGKDTPTRRSTRLRLHSDREDSTPSKKLPSSASVLKNWLRSPPSKTEMKNVSEINTGNDKEKEDKSPFSGTHSMTKVKDRNYSGTNSPPLENGSVKSQKVNPASSAKTRRSVQSRQLTDKHDATPKSKRTDSSSSKDKPRLPSPTTASQHHDDDEIYSTTNDSPTKLKQNRSNKDGSPSKRDKKSLKEKTSQLVNKDDDSSSEKENPKTENEPVGKCQRKEMTKADVFPTPPKRTYLKTERKLSQKMLTKTPESSVVESPDKDGEEDSKTAEKASKEQPPKSKQRRKSEPISSVTKGKVSYKDESHSPLKSAKTAGKSRTISLSAAVPDEVNTKENTKKTPSKQRSRKLSSKTPSKTPTIESATTTTTTGKKSPGPSPGHRRKSLRSFDQRKN